MTTSLSLLASHDEVVRCTDVLVTGACEEEFLQFAINQEEMRQKWLGSIQECQRLHSALEKAHQEAADLDRKLSHARRLLDEEKRRRRTAEEQRNSLERQIAMARDLLFNDGGRNLNDETREKLQFLNNTTLNGRHSNIHIKDLHQNDKLNTIAELDSTGSILSDLSCFSKSEDDLDASIIIQQNQKKREWKEHRPSGEYSAKKRRSIAQKVAELNTSDRIVATTTVVMPKEGSITASSVIEAIPRDENTDPQGPLHSSRKRRKSGDRSKTKLTPVNTNEIHTDTAPSAPKADILTSGSDSEGVFKPSPNIGGYTLNTKSARGHSFIAKTVIKPEVCTPCDKRIRFGKVALKCRDCRATAHTECKDLVPLPCVPTGNTPTLRGISGTIADYTPMIPPMVPSLVVHCINEVELRGMSEQPNLSDVDIATICSTLKDFLRLLREPLITVGLWADFVRATTITDKQDADAALYQAISELPQPNRDTLAFLILHLQRVSSSPECKMPISNLAKVFGPTLVGYSSQDPSPTSLLSETKNQVAIVENLLKIPSDYWANFVNPESLHNIGSHKTGELRHTPSTESLLKRSTSRGFFNTPLASSRTFLRRNKRYFATPPSRAGF
ncbi:Rac GTPase-activating protein 1 [Habropoda laboriosa]|uniref:Rac GTPase-activating protein 1 n=1 Tax=Habropoda laboriosa TaxID=597456 RepID=A0A0L7R442_9HYME|nr:Rac GTPase-activating protein 1 [Habropoda laboriosa]